MVNNTFDFFWLTYQSTYSSKVCNTEYYSYLKVYLCLCNMGDLLFFYNVCKNNNFPQSSEFPESCFNFVQDTVFVNHWSTVSVPSFQYRIISCPCMPGYDRNCNNNGCCPSVFLYHVIRSTTDVQILSQFWRSCWWLASACEIKVFVWESYVE